VTKKTNVKRCRDRRSAKNGNATRMIV